MTLHNRVGHEFRTPDRALDDALRTGQVDRGLPYVRKKGMELLSNAEPSSRTRNPKPAPPLRFRRAF
ncbi:MAG: hypothetical protein HY331_01345 [Chloroflexi bacterium]|nr:hypothetical protein [Chloroflexota bacterium]